MVLSCTVNKQFIGIQVSTYMWFICFIVVEVIMFFVPIPKNIAKERGLHVWNNIQCLPQNLNCSKQNKLIYTEPHEWLYDIPKFFEVVYQQEIAA